MATYVTLYNFTDQGLKNIKIRSSERKPLRRPGRRLECMSRKSSGHKDNTT